ncbi:MAG TPA: sugar kinase [Acetobacteraceae bacterium]|nr:sugar kinase [Acetobacteraceae bacterium]
MTGPALLCMGEPMLEFSELPPDGSGRKLYLQGYGGDTSNAAIAAARQGAKVGYITALGCDEAGEAFLTLWQQEGVDRSAVLRDPDHPTAVYFIAHGPNGHRFSYLRRDSAASHLGAADLPETLIAQAKFFFASGISLGISATAADAVLAAIAIARRAGTKIAIDTNYRPALWPPARAAALTHAAIAKADIALPSLEDAISLTGLTDPDEILDFYLDLGPPVVVLKRGGAGAILATLDRRLVLPGLPVRAVDTTGAGDVFCGSLLARLLAGEAIEAAARYAVAAAALSTTGYGAVAPIPYPADVTALLAPAE